MRIVSSSSMISTVRAEREGALAPMGMFFFLRGFRGHGYHSDASMIVTSRKLRAASAGSSEPVVQDLSA